VCLHAQRYIRTHVVGQNTFSNIYVYIPKCTHIKFSRIWYNGFVIIGRDCKRENEEVCLWCMYVYIHIIYVYMYTLIQGSKNWGSKRICSYACTYYTCTYKYMYMYVYKYIMYLYIHIMYVHMYVYWHICMCVYINICVHDMRMIRSIICTAIKKRCATMTYIT